MDALADCDTPPGQYDRRGSEALLGTRGQVQAPRDRVPREGRRWSSDNERYRWLVLGLPPPSTSLPPLHTGCPSPRQEKMVDGRRRRGTDSRSLGQWLLAPRSKRRWSSLLRVSNIADRFSGHFRSKGLIFFYFFLERLSRLPWPLSTPRG